MAYWNECDININIVIISVISNPTENTSGESLTSSYSCLRHTVLKPCFAAGLRHLGHCTVCSLVCWKMCSSHIVSCIHLWDRCWWTFLLSFCDTCLMSRLACLTSQDVHCEHVLSFSAGYIFRWMWNLCRHILHACFITCMSPVLPDISHNLSSYSMLNIHLQSAYSLYECVCVCVYIQLCDGNYAWEANSLFIYFIYIPWIIRSKSHLDIGIVNIDMDATRQLYIQYEYNYGIRKQIIVG